MSIFLSLVYSLETGFLTAVELVAVLAQMPGSVAAGFHPHPRTGNTAIHAQRFKPHAGESSLGLPGWQKESFSPLSRLVFSVYPSEFSLNRGNKIKTHSNFPEALILKPHFKWSSTGAMKTLVGLWNQYRNEIIKP